MPPSAEKGLLVEVVYTDFDAPMPEDEWCYLAARSPDREAALTWANRAAATHQRRYLVRSGGRGRWLIYPENVERILPPGGSDA